MNEFIRSKKFTPFKFLKSEFGFGSQIRRFVSILYNNQELTPDDVFKEAVKSYHLILYHDSQLHTLQRKLSTILSWQNFARENL